jgi:hypothetical protein
VILREASMGCPVKRSGRARSLNRFGMTSATAL